MTNLVAMNDQGQVGIQDIPIPKVSTAAPQVIGISLAGVSTDVAAADHSHPLNKQPAIANVTGTTGTDLSPSAGIVLLGSTVALNTDLNAMKLQMNTMRAAIAELQTSENKQTNTLRAIGAILTAMLIAFGAVKLYHHYNPKIIQIATPENEHEIYYEDAK